MRDHLSLLIATHLLTKLSRKRQFTDLTLKTGRKLCPK